MAPLVACTARISLLNLWFSKQTARGNFCRRQVQLRLCVLHEYSEKLLNMIMAHRNSTKGADSCSCNLPHDLRHVARCCCVICETLSNCFRFNCRTFHSGMQQGAIESFPTPSTYAPSNVGHLQLHRKMRPQRKWPQCKVQVQLQQQQQQLQIITNHVAAYPLPPSTVCEMKCAICNCSLFNTCHN